MRLLLSVEISSITFHLIFLFPKVHIKYLSSFNKIRPPEWTPRKSEQGYFNYNHSVILIVKRQLKTLARTFLVCNGFVSSSDEYHCRKRPKLIRCCFLSYFRVLWIPIFHSLLISTVSLLIFNLFQTMGYAK